MLNFSTVTILNLHIVENLAGVCDNRDVWISVWLGVGARFNLVTQAIRTRSRLFKRISLF